MPDLIHLAIPAFILLVVAEAIFGAVMHRDLYEGKDTAASLIVWAASWSITASSFSRRQMGL